MFERTLMLIDQELAGTISAEDRDELMEQMMMDPAVADELKRRERALYQNLQTDAQSSRPKWSLLSNAASVVIGAAGAALLLSQGAQEPGLASANVYELDNVRSAALQIRPVKLATGESWVTFMTYPDYPDFSQLDARIEVYQGEPAMLASAPDSAWRTVWQRVSSAGNRDMLVLTLPVDVLAQGVHRLAVYGVADGNATDKPIHVVIFNLEFGGGE